MIIVCLFLIILMIGWLTTEYFIHQCNLAHIPIRIHVNGSRGKSSITRLIAAALREKGIKTFAKTTGTFPRMIIDEDTEYPIFRPSRPNIIEQVRIVTFAARNKAKALIIECMALQPHLQSLTELKLIKATHGVITNVRPDHLDIMGPTEKDVALALLGTTPYKAKLFTAEPNYTRQFQKVCKDRDSEFIPLKDTDVEEVRDEEMNKFSYVEHKENVALALKVCKSLGVSKEMALRGMWKAAPDFGALSEHKLLLFGREIIFINGFAANDPESSEYIWRLALERNKKYGRKIMVINTRADRVDRSRQLGEAIPYWPQAYKFVIIGEWTYQLIRRAVDKGMHPSVFMNAEGMDTEWVFEKIIQLSGRSAMIMGIGNIAGMGMELVTYFLNRSEPP